MFDCFKKKELKIKDQPLKKKQAYPPSYLVTALQITGSFEGSGYNQISGNFDGQGISAGILQWNYGQGSLQNKILRPLIDEYGTEVIDEKFPLPVCQTAYMTPKEAIAFAKKYMLDDKGRLRKNWADGWRSRSPEDRAICPIGQYNRKLWEASSPNHEAKILFIWTCQRVSRNKWADDVISRKGTIAHGAGYVHGKKYDLIKALIL